MLTWYLDWPECLRRFVRTSVKREFASSAISTMRLNGFWLRIPPLENPLNTIRTTRGCLPLSPCMNRFPVAALSRVSERMFWACPVFFLARIPLASDTFEGQLVSFFGLADHFTNGIDYRLGLVDLYIVPAPLDDQVRAVR